MRNNYQKKSMLSRALWLGMAVFFVVFCSSPVKRYIRLALYKTQAQSAVASDERCFTKDVKDCLIADRPEHALPAMVHVCQHPFQPGAPVDLWGAAMPVFSLRAPIEMPVGGAAFRRPENVYQAVPLYLWERHLLI